ncbi:serine/threonine protein kinase [Hokovirus HKV1]|uniref:non-specific serine/threonine protein kinase n=1 Tax=Hokovirus HKV1 TaxID=1977638 RepID=A0A1V0SER8_9VIRU|nr:serine/threonine protein kinase [Hokovirus HKV1]
MSKNKSSNISKIQDLITKDYLIEKKVGSGSFGQVYAAKKKSNDKIQVAIKIEKNVKNRTAKVYDEFKIYKYLRNHNFVIGVAKLYEYIEIGKYSLLVIELLGPSLEDMFNKHNRTFKMPTIYMAALQLIELIECLHKLSFIHRDIKPSNFLLGGHNNKQIYIMDFGLSKKYYYKDSGHMAFRSDKSLVGTARYVSKNMHMGFEPSRRDDLISIGYMLVYFAKGKLPWQGLPKNKNEDSIITIGKMKMSTSLRSLCSQLPSCFRDYLEYCEKLKFDEKPDYHYLKNLFIKSAENNNIKPKFEWL